MTQDICNRSVRKSKTIKAPIAKYFIMSLLYSLWTGENEFLFFISLSFKEYLTNWYPKQEDIL